MKTLEPQDRQKQSREWRYGVWFVLLTSALFLIGCPDGDKENGKEVVRPPAQQEPITRSVTVLLLDGNTERRIAGRAQVTVRNKQGNLAGDIEDLADNRTNTFNVTGGLLAFSVAAQARLPVQLIVVVQAQDFVPSSLPVEVTQDGHQALTLRMVSIAAPPAGVTVAQDTRGQADQNGMVTQAMVVETAPDSITRSTASVTLTPGTTVRSASGTALTGALTTTVVNQNNQNVESLDTFPGGFVVTLAGQSLENVVFLSGGFVTVSIGDTQGNRAKTFSQPLVITMQIPGRTINPNTRKPIANGDQVPIWSYDINTGAWTFEQRGTAVGPNANGNFTVSLQSNHLTPFNIDWPWPSDPPPFDPPPFDPPPFDPPPFDPPPFDPPPPPCVGGAISVTISGGDSRTLSLRVLAPSGGFTSLSTFVNPGPIVSETVQVPIGVPITLEVGLDADVVGSAAISDACTETAVTIPVTLPPENLATLNVQVNDVCPNNLSASIGVPSTPVCYMKTTGGFEECMVTDGGGGIFITGLTAGAFYIVTVQNRRTGNSVTQNILVPGTTTFEFPVPESCPFLTGSSGG